MKKEKVSRVLTSKAARISAHGIFLVIATFLGLYFGLYLDKITNMAPNFTLAFLILGIIVGFKGFIQETLEQRRE